MKSTIKTQILPLLLVSVLASGCGGNPINAAKERDRAVDERATIEQKNKELEDRIGFLNYLVQSVFATTNFVWVLGGALQSQEEALETCDRIGFSLTDSEKFEEFKIEVYSQSDDWKQAPLESFRLSDHQAKSMKGGFVLCVREHEKPFLNLPSLSSLDIPAL